MSTPNATASSDNVPAKVRATHIAQFKAQNRPFTMLTSYDTLTATIFDQAGVDSLLIGDSIGNNVFGYSSTLPVSLEQIIRATEAVSRAAKRALVVADLPFGTYEASDEQAVLSAAAVMKAGAEAVKFEGGLRMLSRVKAVVAAGIPVIGHLGFTPQSVNALGGFKIQGKTDTQAQELLADAQALSDTGVSAIVLEMVPGELAAQITQTIAAPTIGIGAGNGCDGQVLVWTDFAGLNTGKVPGFVKQYAKIGETLREAAVQYVSEVQSRTYPSEDYTY